MRCQKDSAIPATQNSKIADLNTLLLGWTSVKFVTLEMRHETQNSCLVWADISC